LLGEHWLQAPGKLLPGPWQAGVPWLAKGKQSLSVEQAPQVWLLRQAGVWPAHCVVFVDEHWKHWPEMHAGRPGTTHSLSPRQVRQVPVTTSHAGTGFMHTPMFVGEHWPQEPPIEPALVGSQAGKLGSRVMHCVSPVQATHVSVLGSQMGLVIGHLLVSVAEHCTQAPVSWPLVSQTGPPGLPTQSASLVHATHTPMEGLQIGVVPVHAFLLVDEHCTHLPVEVWQAGVGFVHCESVVQGTQVPVMVLQNGVVPEHCVVLVDEHWPQLPSARQAGVFDGHWLSEVHPMHMPLTVLHTGVVPLHALWFIGEHWPQLPSGWQAGVPGWPVQSASVTQATHWAWLTLPSEPTVALSQWGLVPPQLALALALGTCGLMRATSLPSFLSRTQSLSLSTSR
jgi:hypothetical protein